MIAHISHAQRPASARLRRAAAASLVVLAAGLGLAATPAGAATGGGVALGSASTSAKAANDTGGARPHSVGKLQVKRAQTLLRVPATGKHDATTRKVVKRFQELRGLAPYGVIDLTTYVQIRDAFALLQTGGLAIDTTGAGSGGATPATTPDLKLPENLADITPQERQILDEIAECESKGDPTAVSANGKFRGKYQFDRATWRTVGGTGD
ncbi:MAG: transglycosylase family protein, partial [Patulibacter minatonensis]